MAAESARKWAALVLGAVVLSTGCVTVTPPAGRGVLLDHHLLHRGERMRGLDVAVVNPAEMAPRAVASGAAQVDAFEYLLLLAGLDMDARSQWSFITRCHPNLP